MLVVLRQRPPEQAQLVSRMALGVLAVDLIPPRRMLRQLDLLTAEHGHDAAVAVLVELHHRRLAGEQLIRAAARRTSRAIDGPPGSHELAEGAGAERCHPGIRHSLPILTDRLPDRLPAHISDQLLSR